MNVRIWGNYIDRTYVGIGTAATTLGPLYIWRNVGDRSERTPGPDPGNGPFIKAGSNREAFPAKGRTFVFHNTLLQREGSGGWGAGYRIAIQNSGGPFYEVVSRNNLFATSGHTTTTFVDGTNSCTNDWDYDWYDGVVKGVHVLCPQQRHGIRATFPRVSSFVHLDPNAPGRYTLEANAPGIDAGTRLPNFNDDFVGAGPDAGAIEQGGAGFAVGVDAYRGRPRWGM